MGSIPNAVIRKDKTKEQYVIQQILEYLPHSFDVPGAVTTERDKTKASSHIANTVVQSKYWIVIPSPSLLSFFSPYQVETLG